MRGKQIFIMLPDEMRQAVERKSQEDCEPISVTTRALIRAGLRAEGRLANQKVEHAAK